MKEMKTLTLPNGITYEIVDDQARKDIIKNDNAAIRNSAPPIAQTASGSVISVKDSAERPLSNLRLFGNTWQPTTTGSNLLKNTGVNTDAIGVAFTVNSDGSVYAKGTATANAYLTISGGFYNNSVVIPDWLVVGETYTITDATLYLYKSDGSFVSYTNNTVTIPSGYVYYGVFIVITSNASVDRTYYPRINVGDVSLPWEPYTGGMPSPNPDYPQIVYNVDNPTVCIAGANLFDTNRLPSVTKGGVSITNNGNGTLSVTGAGTTTDVCSCEYNISNAEMRLLFHPGKLRLITNVKTYPMVFVNLYKNDKFHSTIMSSNWSQDYAFELPEEYFKNDIYSLRVGLHANSDATIISGLVIPVLTQYEGDITEVYKPTQTVTLQRALKGIPVTSNGNYTDSNGQQWICDEIDFERGVYIQRVGIATMDTCSVIEYTVLDSNGRAQLIAAPQLSKNQHIYGTMCNVASINPAPLEAVSGEYYENPANIVFVGDVGESESSIKEKYANFAYCYILAIPIETPLTEEELAAFDPLCSHSTKTTVMNSYGAWMEMKYSVDIASWVSQYVGDMFGKVDTEKIETAVKNYLNENPVSSSASATVENGVLKIT